MIILLRCHYLFSQFFLSPSSSKLISFINLLISSLILCDNRASICISPADTIIKHYVVCGASNKGLLNPSLKTIVVFSLSDIYRRHCKILCSQVRCRSLHFIDDLYLLLVTHLISLDFLVSNREDKSFVVNLKISSKLWRGFDIILVLSNKRK